MPEGPEIRFLVEMIKPEILNKKLYKIESLSKRKPKIPKEAYIREIGSKGKLIWMRTNENYFIHIHLMLTGWISFEEPDYTKYILYFNDRNMYIDSMRKFTKLSIRNLDEHNKELDRLGIDILTKNFTLDNFNKIIKTKKTNVSKFILDQKYICGVGNYIKSDSLYLSRIYPLKLTNILDDNEIKLLFNSIKYVAFSSLYSQLKEYKLKIPKDILKIAPTKLKIPYDFIVYGETEDPKGNRIKQIDVNGRKTYYVPQLQK